VDSQIEDLIEELGGRGSGGAAARLVKLGSPAVGPLCGALKDPNDHRRIAASAALAEIGAPAVQLLCPFVRDEDRVVRELALMALRIIGQGQKLPRAVMSDERLSVSECVAALDALHAVGQCASLREVLRSLAGDESARIRERVRAAMEVTSLVRASTGALGRQQELLRAAPGSTAADPATELMRESDEPERPAGRRVRGPSRWFNKS
jgi:HEAT repeat protein